MRPRSLLRLLLSLSLGFLYSSLLTAANTEAQPSKALISKARELASRHSPGVPAFQLRARISINVVNGPLEGDYEEVYDGTSKWRRTITFPDFKYKGSTIKDETGEWSWGGETYDSYLIYRLKWLIQPLDLFPPREHKKFSKVVYKGSAGLRVACVDVKWPRRKEELCFDGESGALALDRTFDGVEVEYQYSDFVAVGPALIPRKMASRESGRPLIDFQVTSLELVGTADRATFRPPPGASSWHKCSGKIVQAKLIARDTPSYPSASKEKGEGGKVTLFAVIGTDGRTHQVTPVKAPLSPITTSSISAISRWRYEPTKCNGTPIPVFTFVDVEFTLRR